ncbi:hypothetical protein DM01DRAFT_1079273 [Hesseltinella vesiculosa]|uniref:Uncharacterized protein n=1 Tax=Hesseltinella vesiculosa TaxID=101127 RepID=A0A1X2GWP9_9FUNG|nr:hypothetical protein DM01DRAFT_1079273 [Hesseltinella vesiculosa]
MDWRSFALIHRFCLTKKRVCWKVKVGKIFTVVRLFDILQQILITSVDREAQLLDAIKSICDANIKVYQEILNTSWRLAYSSAFDELAQQGIEKKMRSVKRQLQEDDNQDAAAAKSDKYCLKIHPIEKKKSKRLSGRLLFFVLVIGRIYSTLTS